MFAPHSARPSNPFDSSDAFTRPLIPAPSRSLHGQGQLLSCGPWQGPGMMRASASISAAWSASASFDHAATRSMKHPILPIAHEPLITDRAAPSLRHIPRQLVPACCWVYRIAPAGFLLNCTNTANAQANSSLHGTFNTRARSTRAHQAKWLQCRRADRSSARCHDDPLARYHAQRPPCSGGPLLP